MRSRLLVEIERPKAIAKNGAANKFWWLAAHCIVGLAAGMHIIGHDFTPPPSRGRLLDFFRSRSIEHRKDALGVGFELVTAEEVVSCIEQLTWATTLRLRLVSDDITRAPVPMMESRWMIPMPDRWYLDHEDTFAALIYIGRDPVPSFEIRSTHIEHDQIMRAFEIAVGKACIKVSALASSVLVTI